MKDGAESKTNLKCFGINKPAALLVSCTQVLWAAKTSITKAEEELYAKWLGVCVCVCDSLHQG